MKVAVIGCGHIGSKRARILDALGIETILVDNDIDRAINLSASLKNTAVFVGVNYPEVDAVFVCTPPQSHIKVALQAAEHRKHIFIEKPLTISLRDENLKPLFETVQKNGLIGMMGQSYRHCPTLRQFAEKLDATRKPVLYAYLTAGHYLGDWHKDENWKVSESARMGIELEMWSHSFDTVNWLFGEINAVTALTGNSGHLGIEGKETGTALMRVGVNDAHIMVHADYWRKPYQFKISATLADESKHNAHKWRMEKQMAEEMLIAETKYFLKAVESKIQLQPDLTQGVKNLEWIEAAKLAAETGTWQRIENRWKDLAGRK